MKEAEVAVISTATPQYCTCLAVAGTLALCEHLITAFIQPEWPQQQLQRKSGRKFLLLGIPAAAEEDFTSRSGADP